MHPRLKTTSIEAVRDFLLSDDDEQRWNTLHLIREIQALPRKITRRSYGPHCHLEWVELFAIDGVARLTMGVNSMGVRTLQLWQTDSEHVATVPLPAAAVISDAVKLLKVRAAMLKKPMSKSPAGQPSEDVGWTDLPGLVSFLVDTAYEDGSERARGAITLSYDNGWKVIVRDNDNQRVAFFGGDSIEEMFAALSGHLEADTLDWRPDKFAKRGSKK